MLVGRTVASLNPRYVALDGRGRMGLSLLCPRGNEPDHQEAWDGVHYITLWFADPEDGGPPNHDAAPFLYRHMGNLADLRHLTVYHRDGLPLEVRGHFIGYLIEGELYEALSFGIV